MPKLQEQAKIVVRKEEGKYTAEYSDDRLMFRVSFDYEDLPLGALLFLTMTKAGGEEEFQVMWKGLSGSKASHIQMTDEQAIDVSAKLLRMYTENQP